MAVPIFAEGKLRISLHFRNFVVKMCDLYYPSTKSRKVEFFINDYLVQLVKLYFIVCFFQTHPTFDIAHMCVYAILLHDKPILAQ